MSKTNPAKYGHHTVEQGDSIQFIAGAFRGSGTVKSIGKDGATVTDETGRDHRVHWPEVIGRGKSATKQPKPPDAADAAIQAIAPEETSEQELRRKIPPRVLAKARRK